MGKKVKKTNTILLAITLALIIFTIWTFKVRPVETKKMEVEFSVGPTTGINVNTDKIYFGRIVPGGSSQRTIKVENGYNFPIQIKVSASKEIVQYVYMDKEYTAEPGTTTKIPVTLKIPPDTPYGNYTGELKFDLIKT